MKPDDRARQAWSDERMDESARRTDEFAQRTEENFKEVRVEFGNVREEIKTETRGLRVEMNERFDGIERRFDILFGAMATGLVGAIVAHFIG
jgi:hypothetical protein